MSKPTAKKTTSKTTSAPPAEPVRVVDLAPADHYPLSKRATHAQVLEAGICNGMSADEIETRLSRVME